MEAYVVVFVLIGLGDAGDNNPSKWHLLSEVKVLFVAQFIKTSTNGCVVTNLDETAGLANV